MVLGLFKKHPPKEHVDAAKNELQRITKSDVWYHDYTNKPPVFYIWAPTSVADYEVHKGAGNIKNLLDKAVRKTLNKKDNFLVSTANERDDTGTRAKIVITEKLMFEYMRAKNLLPPSTPPSQSGGNSTSGTNNGGSTPRGRTDTTNMSAAELEEHFNNISGPVPLEEAAATTSGTNQQPPSHMDIILGALQSGFPAPGYVWLPPSKEEHANGHECYIKLLGVNPGKPGQEQGMVGDVVTFLANHNIDFTQDMLGEVSISVNPHNAAQFASMFTQAYSDISEPKTPQKPAFDYQNLSPNERAETILKMLTGAVWATNNEKIIASPYETKMASIREKLNQLHIPYEETTIAFGPQSAGTSRKTLAVTFNDDLLTTLDKALATQQKGQHTTRVLSQAAEESQTNRQPGRNH